MMNKIQLVREDITRMSVDAIVNAANNSLLGGGGVDGAIHKAAGPQLLAECRSLGGCATGQAKISKGYQLPAKYVIHTVGPVWHGGLQNEAELLQSCYQSSMSLARRYALRTIAFPAISCGVYHYPAEQAAAIALTTIIACLPDNPELEKVYLVCFGDQVWRAYGEQYDQLIKE